MYNPFVQAGSQSIDFYGHIGYPKPNYPVVMQQQYYDNYQYNKMFTSQVFTPHVQPIFIAGPIYKNSPVFYGPKYLSQSLFEPVEKRRSYRYQDEIKEDSFNNLQTREQIEENIKIKNELINQWNFDYQQKQNEKPKKSVSNPSLKSLDSHVRKFDLPEIKEETPQQSQIFSTNRRRSRGKKNLKVFFKAASFILMYFLKMKRLILLKRKNQTNKEKSTENVNIAIKQGADWMLIYLEQQLLDFWKKKDPLDWLENESLSEREKNNRMNRVKVFIEQITLALTESVKESTLEREFVAFLAQITQDYEFPPDQYFFNFEVSRLQYNSFAALKNMATPQKKMNLALLLMIRVLGFTILYAPWTLGLPNIKKTPIMEKNAIIIVSVLQELVLGEFREIPIRENNQNHLSLEVKVNQRPQGPLKYLPEPTTMLEKNQQKNMVEPLIIPTYSKDQLRELFEKQPDWVDKIMDNLDIFYSRLVRMVNHWHSVNKIKLTDRFKRKK